ncbi:MAG: type IV pilus twitching motility protein PilT [Roseburia sp.]
MNGIEELIAYGREHDCSDIHLTYGLEPVVRCHGKLVPLSGFGQMDDEQLNRYIAEIMEQSVAERTEEKLSDIDICYQTADGTRNRVNIYRQQRHPAIALRLLNDHIPTLDELHMPPVFKTLTGLHQGLVLVTGPTGSGKSTTLAACIGEINRSQRKHIITIEDPVEYRHANDKCMVNQREIGEDTGSFAQALRSALREDPDIILVGEMRDLETISAAITAAETGHLVFSTLHTIGSAATIERVVGVFPPHQQQQIRTQLATVLKAVISQQLLPKADDSGRVAAQEIMLVTDAVANMIREDKCHQIASVLQTSARMGMQSMDSHLASLAQQRVIKPETAVDYAIEKPAMMQKVGLGGGM